MSEVQLTSQSLKFIEDELRFGIDRVCHCRFMSDGYDEDDICSRHQAIEALKELNEVLSWYADEENYLRQDSCEYTAIQHDQGSLARDALTRKIPP